MTDEDRKFGDEETIKLIKFLEQNPDMLKSSNRTVRVQLKERLRDQIVDKTIPSSKEPSAMFVYSAQVLKYAIRAAVFNLSPKLARICHLCSHPLALATRQNLKKLHYLREQKIARVATALGSAFHCLINSDENE